MNAFNHLGRGGRVMRVAADRSNGYFLDNVHSFDHFAKGGVSLVQRLTRIIVQADEKLAAGAVRVFGARQGALVLDRIGLPRHREHAGQVLSVVELGFEVISRPAGAIAARVAALDDVVA